MQVLDITAELDGVSFAPQSTLEEILQNVRTILTTLQGSVPLDRGFGIDVALIDKPVTIVRSLLTAEIIEKVELYEPRVKVKKVSFAGDAAEGIVRPTVKVVIRDEGN